MIRTRVVPCLLLKDRSFVKTIHFGSPKYLGDPINIVHIFNEKEVDEIVILDIGVTPASRKPDFKMIENIAGECFMPMGYGGGITGLEDMKTLFTIGIEKIIINTGVVKDSCLVRKAADKFGSQSIVVSIDVKKDFFGRYRVFTECGGKNTGMDPVTHAVEVERSGAGEIILNSIDRDGAMEGYDVNLIRGVTSSVKIPVIACGGAGNIGDFVKAVSEGGASAVGAGSMFVFHGPHRAVLISFPSNKELETVFR